MFGNKKSAGENESRSKKILPLLPLRDIIVFPHMVIPLFVGRPKSIRALEEAMKSEKYILLVAQKVPKTNDPATEDLHKIGTIGQIIKLHSLPDTTVKFLVEGTQRARINRFVNVDEYFLCEVEKIVEDDEFNVETEALVRSVNSTFDIYVKLNRKIQPEILVPLETISEPSRLADTIVTHLNLKLDEKQKILEIESPAKRLEQLYAFMQGEIEILQIERKIKTRVRKQMEHSQKEYWLKEQLKAIQKELGMEYGLDFLNEPVFKRLVELFKIGVLDVEKLERYIKLEHEKKGSIDYIDPINKEVLSIEQAAEYLKVSKDDIVRLIQEEGLPGKKIADEWRFSRRALLAWLEEKEKQ